MIIYRAYSQIRDESYEYPRWEDVNEAFFQLRSDAETWIDVEKHRHRDDWTGLVEYEFDINTIQVL